MAEFGYVLGNTMVVLLVVIPVLTMRTLGGEQRQKTDQLLFTAPVKISSIVLGKFFAVLTVFAIPLLALTLCPLVLSRYGTIPLAQSYSCFLAFLFMGATCISIGIFVSSFTENQIAAAVVTFTLLLLSYLINGIGGIIKGNVIGSAIYPYIGWLSLFQRYYDFVDGLFDVGHLVYYTGVTVLFLFSRFSPWRNVSVKFCLYSCYVCAGDSDCGFGQCNRRKGSHAVHPV